MAKKDLAKTIKEKFSYDVADLAVYVDEQSTEILADLTYTSNFLSRVQVMPNVKGSKKLKFMNAEFALQDGDGCAWNADGSVTLTDRQLDTVRVKVQAEFCNDDLTDTWAQMLLAIGANRQDTELPFDAVLSAYAIKQAQFKNQNLIFKGDTTSLNPDLVHYDGLLKLWDNDADLNTVTSLEVDITVANAFSIAQAMANGIPAELLDNGVNVEVLASRTTLQLIVNNIYNDKDYASALTVSDTGGEMSFVLPTTSITFRSYPQIPNDKMYAVPYQFIAYGTDLESDIDGFSAKYNDNDEKLRFGTKWRTGIQYGFPSYFTRLELPNS